MEFGGLSRRTQRSLWSPSPDPSHEGRGNYSSDSLSFPLSQRGMIKQGRGKESAEGVDMESNHKGPWIPASTGMTRV